MKWFVGSFAVRVTVLTSVLIISSCASVANESADVKDCRETAYGKPGASLRQNADAVFAECNAKRAAMKAEAESQETALIWFEFLLDLFVPVTAKN